ncbi:MAG: glycerol-3-phosphate 1-O-acyltransferase PlsY [bacterium]
MLVVGLLILSYLCGSIPMAYLVARGLKGVDIRSVGSGNIGATNAARVVGMPLAGVILLLDAAKGALPVILCRTLVTAPDWGLSPELAALLVGIAAVLGHIFTCFLNFKGGKGVSTSLGVFSALAPVALLSALAVGIVVIAITRFVSLASVLGAVAFPLLILYFQPGNPALFWVSALIGALIIFRHRSNIRRIIRGEEDKFWG